MVKSPAAGGQAARWPDTEAPDTRPIARLRRIVAALEAARLPSTDDRAWLLAGAYRYEAACLGGGGLGFDQALGLGRHGARGWWSDEARHRRDRLLLELRAQHFAHLDDRAAADEIVRLARRVEAGTGAARTRLTGLRDPAAELMAAVLLTGQPVPGAKQLRRILNLGHEGPSFVSMR